MTHVEQAERRKAIAEARAKGVSLADLARQFGVCCATIRYACRENAVELEDLRRRKKHPFEVLAKLKAPDYASDAQVGRECGLSRERVGRIKERARKLGLL